MINFDMTKEEQVILKPVLELLREKKELEVDNNLEECELTKRNNTYFDLDGRLQFNSESVRSIIGYYNIISPVSSETEKANFLKEVKESQIGSEIVKDESDEDFLKLVFYKGQGDYVEELEYVYHYKEEIEKKVEAALSGTELGEYDLIIDITTLHG